MKKGPELIAKETEFYAASDVASLYCRQNAVSELMVNKPCLD